MSRVVGDPNRGGSVFAPTGGVGAFRPEIALEFPDRQASGALWLGMGFIALCLGILERHAGLAVFGILLIVAVLLLARWTKRVLQGIELERSAPRSAFEGERTSIDVQIEHAGGRVHMFPEVAEVFAPEFQAIKRVVFPDEIGPEKPGTQSYGGYCLAPRGVHRIGPTALRVCDPFGMTESTRFDARMQLFKVYPGMSRLSLDPQIGQILGRMVNERTDKRIGESSEYWSAREYRSGDDLRRLHWRLTARNGVPHVREDSAHLAGSLTLLIDGHPDSLAGFGRSSSLEVSVRLAVSLGRELLEKGRRFQLLWPERDMPTMFRGGRPSDFPMLLDHTVAFRLSENRPRILDALPTLEGSLRRSGTIVLALSPYTFTDERLERGVVHLRRRGFDVHAVLFEDRDDFDREITALQMQRRLGRLGVSAYVHNCGDLLERELAAQLQVLRRGTALRIGRPIGNRSNRPAAES